MVDYVDIKTNTCFFYFESENGLFCCEVDDRNSGGYLYIGFSSTEKYDEMIKNQF